MFRNTCTFLNGSVPFMYLEPIYQRALCMLRDQERHGELHFDEAEGCLTTDFSAKALVQFSGIAFSGTLEVNHRTCRFDFIVDPTDVDLETFAFWDIFVTSNARTDSNPPRLNTPTDSYGSN